MEMSGGRCDPVTVQDFKICRDIATARSLGFIVLGRRLTQGEWTMKHTDELIMLKVAFPPTEITAEIEL